jgi:phosphotransferase system  glucose/maltose/N-acetylglucosamine-specific IIC component
MMSVLIAVAHVIGSVIAMMAFGFTANALAAWELKRNQKTAKEEMSVALGIPVKRLDDAEHSSAVIQFAAARFSSDRLQNRLSDLCWWVQGIWGWVGSVIQVGLLIGVIWYSVTDSPSNAVYAWWVVAIAIFFWVTGVLFNFVCKLFTGRFPGEAKQVRKHLAEFVSNQQIPATHAREE